MNVSTRFLCMAFAVLALFATTTGARAQGFPVCNAGGITIQNTSPLPITLCIKGVACFDVPANTVQFFPLPVGTQIPGIYGVANVSYQWQPTGGTPALWLPGLAMLPTGRCFDVYFDEPSCSIRVVFVGIPPCLHP